MKPSPSGVLRSALQLLSLRLVLGQIAVAGACFLLFVAWLNMPDAKVWALIGSSLLALAIVAGGSVAETWLLLSLAETPRTRRRVLVGALVLLVAAGLWLGWTSVFSPQGSMAAAWPEWAGYINSKAPAILRYGLTYEHLLIFFEWVWQAIGWFGGSVLGALACNLIACDRPLRGLAAVLRSFTFWVVTLLASVAAAALTGLLMNWTPGHGFAIELLSLVVRLGIAIGLDAMIACLLLCVIAVWIRRTNAVAGQRVD